MSTVIPFDQAGADLALAQLRAGAIIAFPTDTVYGVGGNALDGAAILQVFAAKQRLPSVPLPILLADVADLALVAAHVPALAYAIAAAHWPGALTLVLPAAAHLPPELLAGNRTVAVRIPDHAALRQLIRDLGAPLAGTSANRHGQPAPSSAAGVEAQLGGRVPLILDGGPSGADQPSTILDLSGASPRVLREGALPLAALRQWLEKEIE
ncbi:MAG: threonylcarbamoyl-AMP synthase [Herpetosiphonaceae bacterium]|nr:threonylcarbamoyl-AMP synthase [Herpetosiphonaceae bacterium]